MNAIRPAGGNNSDLTEMNRSLIVKLLQQREVCSRAELAELTGLTQAAITKITATLIDMGIIAETGLIQGRGKRRSIGLRLVSDRYKVIGVKFARQMFAIGVFDISGKAYVHRETRYDIHADPQLVLEEIRTQILQYLDLYEDVVAIGFAVPGPYLRKEGRIAVVTGMPAWGEVNFRQELEGVFRVPVFIEHDANAGALAEWWFGEGENMRTLCYFLLGEGVGCGVIERGDLVLGAQGISGEVGHISIDVDGPRCECGNHGCLELYCSVPAVLAQARQKVEECPQSVLAEQQPLTLDALFGAARCGDTPALQVVKQLARRIGYGCVLLINAYNPSVISIGDAIASGGDLLLDTVLETVQARVIPQMSQQVRIQFTSFQLDPILYGAAALATDKILKMPSAFSVEKR